MTDLRLPFVEDETSLEARIEARDRAGRARAVDPRFDVVLEASAGTGKTRVLVDRYVNLLRAGVDPSNILAITFTRKASAEMRSRIMDALRTAAARGELAPARWRELRDRTADITISTIDAFCLSLLREFPLEADLDPGFSMLDETEVPRLIDESLDRTLRICRGLAHNEENVALVFAQLGERRVRAALAALLGRRIVAAEALSRFVATGPADLDIEAATRRAAAAMLDVFEGMRGGIERFITSGPLEPAFAVLSRGLRRLQDAVREAAPLDAAAVQATFARIREHVLTQDGEVRARLAYARTQFASEADWRLHRDLVTQHGDAVRRVIASYRRDANVLVSRGIWRAYRVADAEYGRTLESHAALDFSELLLRALRLLRQMEEFARSRYRLESRYHHVLVDECQDTSRAQWELVSLLIQSWGEGAGLAHSGPLQPSVFVVGDRKQSIYGFRDADVGVLREAARHIGRLRGNSDVRRTISRSFRSMPPILSFVNDVCQDLAKTPDRTDAFAYAEEDRFLMSGAGEGDASRAGEDAIGLVAADGPEGCAEIAAAEIVRLVGLPAMVRDRDTGVRRPMRPGDVAIIFRTRDSHREFEAALTRRGIPAHVYKGLGFFDADEIKDVLALLGYLADPLSDLRAAAFLRSRFVRISDDGLRLLGPALAEALRAGRAPDATSALDAADAGALAAARSATAGWRALVDRVPPAELLDCILTESAYGLELRGARYRQARENLKKIRSLVRRIQNRGYTTLARIAAHLDRLSIGDEANAIVDAADAVSLLTVHAAKGLEFPVVFLVNLSRGTGNRRPPIRVSVDPEGDSASVSVGDYQSDADGDSRARELEETKRLLYVALTRARDRLYLGSVLKDGRVQPGRGSLAEVMPPSLLEQFATAGRDQVDLQWRAGSGTVHHLRRASGEPACDARTPVSVARQTTAAVAAAHSDFTPLVDRAPRRRSIAAALPDAPGDRRRSQAVDHDDESDRLAGTLVHRLLHRFGLHEADDTSIGRETVLTLLRPGEEDASGAQELAGAVAVDRALAAYRAICARPDVRERYSCGAALHEVPFTMHVDGTWLRGTIDCLVRTGDRVAVLEFKTGRPREEHRTQVDLYRQAAARIFPDCTIEACLVYAGLVPR